MEVFIILIFVCLVIWLVLRGQKSVATASNLGMLPERFVIFDLETTGLDPSKHEIIEIGAIRVNRDGEQHDTFETLIKPSKRIPKRITEITGITQEMVELDGVSIIEALTDFQAFVGELPLVAFNAQFDQEFLRAASTLAATEHFSNEVYCALQLSRRAWPGRKSYRLSELAKDGSLALDGQHRALGDCKRTMIVYAAAAQVVGSYR